MIWLFDPFHRMPRRWRLAAYAWLAVYFIRLTVWYSIEDRFCPV